MDGYPEERLVLAARAASAGLRNAGFSFCLVGSMACYEHGSRRLPNDVDILVLDPNVTQEEVHDVLLATDSGFSATNELNATYRVLFYGTGPSSCRVDIFLPGVAELPSIPPDCVVQSARHDLPVMPLLPVLLHKVLAWMYHESACKEQKQINDVIDITELSRIAVARRVTLAHANLATDFLEEALAGFRQFAVRHPESLISGWSAVGPFVERGVS